MPPCRRFVNYSSQEASVKMFVAALVINELKVCQSRRAAKVFKIILGSAFFFFIFLNLCVPTSVWSTGEKGQKFVEQDTFSEITLGFHKIAPLISAREIAKKHIRNSIFKFKLKLFTPSLYTVRTAVTTLLKKKGRERLIKQIQTNLGTQERRTRSTP